MDLNWILLWISGISSAINLAATLRRSDPPAWGWRAVLTAMLLVIGALMLTVPHVAGYITGPLWFVFVLMPGILLGAVNRLLARQKYRRALWLARTAAFLHPADGWPQQTQMVQALKLIDAGQTDDANVILNRLASRSGSLGNTARLIQTQQSGDWQGLLTAIEVRHSPASVLRDESLLFARSQALGELGRVKEMLDVLQAVLEGNSRISTTGRRILLMRTAALSGRVDAAEQQLANLTRLYADDVRRFWSLTARQVAGDSRATAEFENLEASASNFLKPMIRRRVQQPLPTQASAESNTERDAALRALSEQIEFDAQYAVLSAPTGLHQPWATWTITFVLIASFLREMFGDTFRWEWTTEQLLEMLSNSMNPNNLIDMGALVIPLSVTPGEWWRVLTAGFLHFGPIHLGLNLLGLLALGPRLERAWGFLPVIVCYTAATFSSMALAPYAMSLTAAPEPQILVGASGGMMGLLGGLLGFLSVGWFRQRTPQTRNSLVLLVLIVCLQTTFDFSTPNVSFTCHALGLATGAVFGVAWTLVRGPRALPGPKSPLAP